MRESFNRNNRSSVQKISEPHVHVAVRSTLRPCPRLQIARLTLVLRNKDVANTSSDDLSMSERLSIFRRIEVIIVELPLARRPPTIPQINIMVFLRFMRVVPFLSIESCEQVFG